MCPYTQHKRVHVYNCVCVCAIGKSFDIVVTGIGGSGTTAVINRITGSANEVDYAIGHVGELTRTKSRGRVRNGKNKSESQTSAVYSST